MEDSVYPPSEDTLLLASAARQAGAAAEVGCGSGAATLQLAREAGHLLAIDVSSRAAMETLRRALEGGAANIDVLVADTLAPVRSGSLDVVYSNPPYLPCSYEEEPLWCGGERGVEFSLRLAEEAWRVLKPGGCLVVVASTLSDVEGLLRGLSSLFARVKVLAREHVGLYERLLLVEACSPRRDAETF